MAQSMFFYNFEAATVSPWTVSQWFQTLAQDSLKGEASHIYSMRVQEPFEIDDNKLEVGVYYVRAVKDDIEEVRPFCKVRKLPFSELVYLSDVFSRVLPLILPVDDEIKNLVDKGETARFLEKEVPTKGLERLRVVIADKYFDHSLTGTVRRFFSAIINFFRKYNLYIETGIFWPGDSIAYADKVIAKVEGIKQEFAKNALELSKEVLSDRLDISLEVLESLNLEEIKKLSRKKLFVLHPDKNPSDDASDKFNALNRVWNDFNQLVELSGGWVAREIADDQDETSNIPALGVKDKPDPLIPTPPVNETLLEEID